MSYGYDLAEFQGEPDLETYKVLILDTAHFVPAVCPLYFQGMAHHLALHAHHLGCDYVTIPTASGWAWRSYKGYWYATVEMTTDEQAREREPEFRGKMTRFLADPWAPWEGLKS